VQRDLTAGRHSRHAGKTYELEGLDAIGGDDLAELLATALGRPVGYQPVSLLDTRKALADSGLEPYQLTHALSLLSNANAGMLEAHHSDLAGLLPTAPRPVRDLMARALKSQ